MSSALLAAFEPGVTECIPAQALLPDWDEFSIDQAIGFKTMLIGILSRFLNPPPGDSDREIDDALCRVCQSERIDRASFWHSSTQRGGTFTPTHERVAIGGLRVSPRQSGDAGMIADGNIRPTEELPRTACTECALAVPWMAAQAKRGKIVAFSHLDDLPVDAYADKDMLRRQGVRAGVVIPVRVDGKVVAALSFGMIRRSREWSELLLKRLELLTQAVGVAIARREAAERLRTSLAAQPSHMPEETARVVGQPRDRQRNSSIVGSSGSLLKVIQQAEQAAPTDSTILLLGETGTGKELLARYAHSISKRLAKPLITTNIAAIPATLLESELFGREKGAYTGALAREIGRFEMADGGTLFLDEIGEMPLETQAKLLRVLQSGEFERLGSGQTRRVDVRVIAATNRKLPELIKADLFRQDLFYRLSVFPITLPPLRERQGDVSQLVWAFVKELSNKMGKPIERIHKKDLESLESYGWPGNVRELRNVVERSMILAQGTELHLVLPEGPEAGETGDSRRLRDVEKEHIQRVLAATEGKIYGSKGAAGILGIKPTTLYSMLQRLGIERPSERERRHEVTR